MYIFLITFLFIYGGMHLYAFIKLREAFKPSHHMTQLLTAWLTVMTVIPLLVRGAEQLGMKTAALSLALPGFIWMGFLLIFTSTLIFTDLLRILNFLITRFVTNRLPMLFSKEITGKIALGVAIVASIYACLEAGWIKTEHVEIASHKLPPSVPRVRIVQVSDVHIGLLLQKWRLQRILEIIRAAKPDILVSTGDLIDGKLNRDDTISERNPLAALLAAVPSPHGKYAVVGNHEVYAGLPQALSFSRAAGFTILSNQTIQLNNGIAITGIDDRAVNPDGDVRGTEAPLLNMVSQDLFRLLLKHRPEILPESDGRFNLQLSGHVHGGQIFPFNFLVKLVYPIPCGTTSTKAGSQIHVSRGTGTWGPPMRLFAPPEITIIDIVAK